MKIILDTNFLVDCIRFNIDLKSELAGDEILVLDAVVSELKRIARTKAKDSVPARLALEFIERNNIGVLRSKDNNTDDSLVSYSKEGYAIATHDRALKKRLKMANAKVVFIRQKRYVVSD